MEATAVPDRSATDTFFSLSDRFFSRTRFVADGDGHVRHAELRHPQVIERGKRVGCRNAHLQV